jgi:ribose transport system ATP-binding protein
LEPQVLLLNDPTRGVDIRTRHALYDVFATLADAGMALVVLSTEIEEILRLCDRVLVFREGTVQARLDYASMTVERVIAAMFGRAA